VQESLTNVIRHSGARRAAVTARLHDGRLELVISDDGHGRAGQLNRDQRRRSDRDAGADHDARRRVLRRQRRPRLCRTCGATRKAGPVIRIVLVDDQEVVRAGLRTLAERDGDIQVVAEAGTGTAGLSRVRELRPDVVLMDIRMPQMDGLEATRRIVADPQLSNVKVLVLTTFDEDEHVFEAIRSGAAGYLLKDVSPADLRRAIRLVAAGDSLLAPSVTRTVMRLVAAQPHTFPDDSPLRELTEREREVLASVGRGLSNDEIARELFISPATARTYVSRLLTKLGARDRARLVVLAYETGLVTPRS
jgi:DNA-binding NarL/FixJ family response regulator